MPHRKTRLERGTEHLRKGRFEDAIREFWELKKDPRYEEEAMAALARAYLGRGKKRLEEGAYDEGLGGMERAVALSPGDPYLHNELGVAHFSIRDIREARKSFDTAIRLSRGKKAHEDTYLRALHNRAATLLFDRRPDEASSDLDEVLGKAKGREHEVLRGEALHHKAKAQIMLGKHGEAVKTLHERLAMGEDAHTLMQLGKTHESVGDMESAHRSYQRAHELAPEDPDVLAYYSEFLLGAGLAERMPELKRAYYEKALELAKRGALASDVPRDDLLGTCVIAVLRLGSERENRALDKHLGRLQKRMPDDHRAPLYRAVLANARGEPRKAVFHAIRSMARQSRERWESLGDYNARNALTDALVGSGISRPDHADHEYKYALGMVRRLRDEGDLMRHFRERYG